MCFFKLVKYNSQDNTEERLENRLINLFAHSRPDLNLV